MRDPTFGRPELTPLGSSQLFNRFGLRLLRLIPTQEIEFPGHQRRKDAQSRQGNLTEKNNGKNREASIHHVQTMTASYNSPVAGWEDGCLLRLRPSFGKTREGSLKLSRRLPECLSVGRTGLHINLG